MTARFLKLRGAARKEYLSHVYDMAVLTYQSVGLPFSSPSDLLQEDYWVVFIHDGQPVAFNLYKTTKFGLKSTLSGSDGSPAGKSLAVANLRTRFKAKSVYGEVSHKVEAISLAAGAPIIPVKYVPYILGKDVQPSADGMHYTRSITGVGLKEKIMVGRPNLSSLDLASIPDVHQAYINKRIGKIAVQDDLSDYRAHIACLI